MLLKRISWTGVAIATICLLSSCSAKLSAYELKNDTIEVETKITGCELIKTWDGIEIENSFISNEGDYIALSTNKKINCSLIDTSNLGMITIKFEYKNKTYISNIEIIDTTAPQITADNDYYEVEINNEYFKLDQLFVVQDNYYSINELTIATNGDFNKAEVGKYNVQITAMDPSLNKASKNIVIEVVDKEVIVQQIKVPGKTEYVQIPGNSGSDSNTKSDNITNHQSSSEFYYEESWSSSGSYEVDSGVTVEHKVE